MCVAKYKKKTLLNKGDMPPMTAVLLLLVLLGAAMLLWFVRVGRRRMRTAKGGTPWGNGLGDGNITVYCVALREKSGLQGAVMDLHLLELMKADELG